MRRNRVYSGLNHVISISLHEASPDEETKKAIQKEVRDYVRRHFFPKNWFFERFLAGVLSLLSLSVMSGLLFAGVILGGRFGVSPLLTVAIELIAGALVVSGKERTNG